MARFKIGLLRPPRHPKISKYKTSPDKLNNGRLTKLFLILGFIITLASTVFTVLLLSNTHRYAHRYRIERKLEELSSKAVMYCYQCEDDCVDSYQALKKCPARSVCTNITNSNADKVKMFCSINKNKIGCTIDMGFRICHCNRPGCNGPNIFEKNLRDRNLKFDSNFTDEGLTIDEEDKNLRDKIIFIERISKHLLYHIPPNLTDYNNMTVDEKLAKLKRLRKQLWDQVIKDWDREDHESEMLPLASNPSGYQNTSKVGDRETGEERVSEQKNVDGISKEGSRQIESYHQRNSINFAKRFCEKLIYNFVEKNIFFNLKGRYKTCVKTRFRRRIKSYSRNAAKLKRKMMKRQIQEDGYRIIVNRDRSSDYIVPQNEHSDKDGENLIMPERGRQHYYIVPKRHNFQQSQSSCSLHCSSLIIASVAFVNFFETML